jgi:hypothetical protein
MIFPELHPPDSWIKKTRIFETFGIDDEHHVVPALHQAGRKLGEQPLGAARRQRV